MKINKQTDNLRVTYDLHGGKVIFTVEVDIDDMEDVIQTLKDNTFDYFVASVGFKKKRRSKSGVNRVHD